MIQRWNSTVSKNDRVLHLGDFSFGWRKQRDSVFKQLNGEILIIRGNHDPPNFVLRKTGFLIPTTGIVEIGNIVFSHYPLPYYKLNGKVNVHGHIHNQLNTDRYHINACVDVTNYYPLSIEHYIKLANKIMENK